MTASSDVYAHIFSRLFLQAFFCEITPSHVKQNSIQG